jgi:hypothetical protein
MGKYLGTHDFTSATVTGVTATDAEWDATVGSTGANYTTINGAVTAGKSRILVITNVTETSATALAAGTVLQGINRTIAVTMSSVSLTVGNNCTIRNITFKADLYDGSFTALTYSGTSCLTENVAFEQTATSTVSANCYFATVSGQYNKFINMQIKGTTPTIVANNWSAIGLASGANLTEVRNMTLEFTGSEYGMYAVKATAAVEAVILDGIQTNEAMTYNAFYIGCNGTYWRISNCTQCSYVLGTLAESTLIGIAGGFVSAASGNHNILANSRTSSLTISGNSWSIDGCSLGGLTVSGTGNVISACAFAAGVTLSGNYNTIAGSIIGAYTGGGSDTITVSGGATGNVISDCKVDAAISNSGTNTTYSYEVF